MSGLILQANPYIHVLCECWIPSKPKWKRRCVFDLQWAIIFKWILYGKSSSLFIRCCFQPTWYGLNGYCKNRDICTLRSEMIPAGTQAAPADRYPDAWWAEMGSRGLPEIARLDWEIGLDRGVFWLRKHSVQLDNVHLLVWSISMRKLDVIPHPFE